MSAQPIDFSKYAAPAAPASASTPSGQIDFSKYEGSPRTWKDSVADTVGEWWKQVNPVANIQGAAQAANHPIDTIKNMGAAQGAVLDKAIEAFKKGDHVEGVRHFLNYLTPLIGPQTDAAGDLIDKGEYAKAAGMTGGIATNVATPAIVKGAGNLVKPVASRALLLGKTPAEAYTSALKPSTTLSDAERASVVKTGLDNKIPVSEAGLTKLGDLIDQVNAKMDAAIPANSAKTVNKFAVSSRLSNVADRFTKQVNPEADLAAVSNSGEEFIRNQPGEIPVKDAAAIKSGTYQQLGSKSYGELATAAKESQKALARGIKEELITQFPELESLGLKDQKFYNLQDVLERAVNRTSNHQLIGIGTPVVAGAAKAVTGSGGAAAVLGTMKAVLDNPNVKSRLAIMLNKAGVPLAQVSQRVNAYHSALAAAAVPFAHESSESRDGSPNQ